ncbi:hypothetical protein PR048_016973 [Dryococelus australis]|uniref:Uncharacterized protein n=1 Tax=Dryococelus australis TaxID=614101 RepID=A0ABQ9H874_9NEOP|nr:hypothetical protein PR048_016973 [Dryococelus australis]
MGEGLANMERTSLNILSTEKSMECLRNVMTEGRATIDLARAQHAHGHNTRTAQIRIAQIDAAHARKFRKLPLNLQDGSLTSRGHAPPPRPLTPWAALSGSVRTAPSEATVLVRPRGQRNCPRKKTLRYEREATHSGGSDVCLDDVCHRCQFYRGPYREIGCRTPRAGAVTIAVDSARVYGTMYVLGAVLPLSGRWKTAWITRILCHLRLVWSSVRGDLPRFSHVAIVPDDAGSGRVFSGIPRFPRPCIPAMLHTNLTSRSSALKSPMLRAAQISYCTTVAPFEFRAVLEIEMKYISRSEISNHRRQNNVVWKYANRFLGN